MTKAAVSKKGTLGARMDALENQVQGDGWMNVLTGAGVAGRDKRVSTRWGIAGNVLTEALLMDIYRVEGFAKRVVDLPANDMTRQWFKVDGDPDGGAVKYLDELNARSVYTKALKWSRLYGGSIIVMGIDDGTTGDDVLEQPLNENNIKKVGFLHVYEKPLLSRFKRYEDPNHEKFGQTEVFQVNPISGMPFKVHETRVLQFDGVDVPMRARAQNQGWGDSVVQSMYSRIRGLADSYVGVETLISEYIIGVFTIDNLQDLIANGEEDQIRRRLQIIDLSRHMLNSVLVDKEEDYKRISASAAGLHNLINKLEQALSAVTGLPVTLLFGMSPAGLKATGASDVRFYYDTIAAQQDQRLRAPCERLVDLVYRSDEGPDLPKGDEKNDDATWSIKFVPLWEPTEQEIIESRSTQSETDQRYVDMGAITPGEITLSRFGGDEYSVETHVSDERLQLLREEAAAPPDDGGEGATE